MATPAGKFRASIRFRESKVPLFKAKIPVNFFGIPLFTGCSVGLKDELSLLLGTSLDAGSSLRFAFHPNDDKSPATIILKIGLGKWASANDSMFSLSTEYDIGSRIPRLMFRTIPRVGDFSLRRLTLNNQSQISMSDSNTLLHTQQTNANSGFHSANTSNSNANTATGQVNSNVSCNPIVTLDSSLIHTQSSLTGQRETESGPSSILSLDTTALSNPTPTPSPTDLPSTPNVSIALNNAHAQAATVMRESKWSLGVRSSLPLGNQMNGFLRWRLNLPSSVPLSINVRQISFEKLPTLVLDKASFVARAGVTAAQVSNPSPSPSPSPSLAFPSPSPPASPLLSSAARMTSMASPYDSELIDLRNELKRLSSENQILRKTMDDFRTDLNHRLLNPSNSAAGMYSQEELKTRSQVVDNRYPKKTNAGSKNDPFESTQDSKAVKESKKNSSSDSKSATNGCDWRLDGRDESQSSISEDLRKAIEAARAKNERR